MVAPESPAEGLWYRGFLYRGFDSADDEPVEYFYLPDELLAQLPSAQVMDSAEIVTEDAMPVAYTDGGGTSRCPRTVRRCAGRRYRRSKTAFAQRGAAPCAGTRFTVLIAGIPARQTSVATKSAAAPRL